VKWRPFVLACILLAISLSLGQALVTRDGVGVFEYLVGAALLAALLLNALRLSRRAFERA
jgi:hypothetical protein